MNYTRDAVLKELRENVIEVSFSKVNGENRLMRCTLRSDLLPPSYVSEEKEEKDFHKTNRDAIACWDVTKGGWRSFKIDTVHYVQVIDGY